MQQGELLAGRYEVGAVIGRGGMGEVRSGRDLRLGRTVALKQLRPDLAGQPGVRRRFEGEARAAARLSHPHVVAIHDVGEDAGVPFIVMERVVGPTLHDEMLRGPMEENRARAVGAQILDALAAAHAAGIIHRDVKPGNILLTADGSAKVADFGIAKAMDEDGTAELDLTGANQVLGTVAYLSPERLAGEPATVQSDLYSVGVILYEALSGRRPFAGDTPMAVAWAIHNGSPEPLSALRPDLDPGLVATVERIMAPRPEDRFTTAAEAESALRARGAPAGAAPGSDVDPTVLAARAAPATEILSPVAPPPPPQPHSAAPTGDRGVGRRRFRWWAGALAVGAVAALLAVAAAGVGSGGDADPAPAEAPAPGVPPPLADALDRLERSVR